MRGKTVPPPEGAQASQGQVRQVSQLFGEAIGDTNEWIEIHRTSDEWEAQLIQTTLSAQQIRCRPIELKAEGQTALLVDPEDEVLFAQSRTVGDVQRFRVALQFGYRSILQFGDVHREVGKGADRGSVPRHGRPEGGEDWADADRRGPDSGQVARSGS